VPVVAVLVIMAGTAVPAVLVVGEAVPLGSLLLI
jgi:hypothetical protein